MNKQERKSSRSASRLAKVIVAATLGAASVGIATTSASATSFFPRPIAAFGTLFVFGSNGPDTIALRVGADDPTVVRMDVGDDGTTEFTIRRSTFTRITIFGFGGDDRVRIDESQVTFTDVSPTLMFGGAGNDTLLGGAGNDTFFGNEGDDFVDGGRGADTALLGSGDDRFQWDPGEGSDVVEGQGGTDAMVFNGAGGDEIFDVSANGQRVRFFRNVGNITMDLDGVEQIDLATLAGVDNLLVHDMAGTSLTTLDANLEGTLGSGTGDGAIDTITVEGTTGDDSIAVSGASGAVTVAGLVASVNLAAAEPTDVLLIDTLAGTDTTDSGGLAANTIGLTVL
jgi:hypothetical protein